MCPVAVLEAEADALNQLSTDDLAGKVICNMIFMLVKTFLDQIHIFWQFALLEGDAVDDDLAALKREMLGSPKVNFLIEMFAVFFRIFETCVDLTDSSFCPR